MRAGARRTKWGIAAAACLAVMLTFSARPAPAQQPDLAPGYWERSDLPQMGLATFYARGMMEYVVNYREQHGQLPRCPDCVGAVALLRAGDIGRKVWLQLPGSDEVSGPFLVVDCARREDVPMLLERNWEVDVSYEVGQTWGMTGPLAGVIVWPDPAEGNNPPPPAQPTQFYVDPNAVVISAPTAELKAAVVGPLPTRLPGPRPSARASSSGTASAAPAPLTPVVTTPTPSGSRPAAGSSASSGSALVGQAGTESDVSLGRPGQELLLLAARPASFLQSPTPTLTPAGPNAGALPTPTASASHAPETTLTGVATPPSGVQSDVAQGLLQRVWHAIVGLLSANPAH